MKGKIVQKAEPERVGGSKLLLSKAVLVDTTGSIEVDLWESNVDQVEPGKVYLISSIQVRVWNRRKKLSTTRSTIITPLSIDDVDDGLKNIPVQTHDEPTTTTVVLEFTAVTKYEKFKMCNKCLKKIPQPTSETIARCSKCGIIRADKCITGVSATVTALTEVGEELHLKFGNEILSTMLNDGILPCLDEEVLAEKFLFLEPRRLQYDSSTASVLVIEDIDDKH